MRILAFSDIHVDINNIGSYEDNDIFVKFIDKFCEHLSNFKGIDIVICAGDISPSIPDIVNTLERITDALSASEYLFVPGNHDVWNTETSIQDEPISKTKYEMDIPDAIQRTKFKYLPSNPLIMDDNIAFVGNIAWYDYTFQNPQWKDVLKEKKVDYFGKVYDGMVWNDAKYAKWGMPDAAVSAYLMEQLKHDFEKIQNIPTKIAITHHIPFKAGVHYKNQIDWDYFSAFMGAARFGELFLEQGVKLAIHGHTHFPLEYQVAGCQVYCPAVGYRTEWKTRDLNTVFTNRIKIINLD